MVDPLDKSRRLPVHSPSLPVHSSKLDDLGSLQSSARKPTKAQASKQRWTTPKALASILGYAEVTIHGWLRTGKVIAGRASHNRHYADERTRATGRGQWRIHEDEVLELLAHMRQGKTIRSFGRGFWKTKP